AAEVAFPRGRCIADSTCRKKSCRKRTDQYSVTRCRTAAQRNTDDERKSDHREPADGSGQRQTVVPIRPKNEADRRTVFRLANSAPRPPQTCAYVDRDSSL